MDFKVELQLYIYFDDMYMDIKYCAVLKVEICDAIMTHASQLLCMSINIFR